MVKKCRVESKRMNAKTIYKDVVSEESFTMKATEYRIYKK